MNPVPVSAVTSAAVRAESGADPAWRPLYRVGGCCLVAAGACYLAGAVLSNLIGPAPGGSEEYLQGLAGHAVLSGINFGLFGLADLLFVPAVLGLYHALKHLARNAMLIAAALVGVFIVLDLAVTEVSSLALLALAPQYAAGTGDSARAAAVAAASYVQAILPIATFLSYFVSSVGFLIVAVVMLRGVFRRSTAYPGIIGTSLGIVGAFYVVLPPLAVLLSPCLVAFGVFLVLAGLRSYGLTAARNRA